MLSKKEKEKEKQIHLQKNARERYKNFPEHGKQ